MPARFTYRDEPPRKPELPLQLHGSMHADTAAVDMRGYLDGVRDSIEALRSRGHLAAAAELMAMRNALLGTLGGQG